MQGVKRREKTLTVSLVDNSHLINMYFAVFYAVSGKFLIFFKSIKSLTIQKCRHKQEQVGLLGNIVHGNIYTFYWHYVCMLNNSGTELL